MKNNKKLNFVFLWRQNDWGLYKRRNESILWELYKRDFVKSILHVEPITPKGFINIILKWVCSKDKIIKRTYFSHIKKALSLNPLSINIKNKNKIFIYSVFVLYSGDFALLRWLSIYLVRFQLGFISKRFVQSKKNVILVAYPPADYLIEAINLIKYDLLIADLVDDVIVRTQDKNKKEQFKKNYKDILGMCSCIFSTSPTIRDKYSSYAKSEIEFLPNGVEPDEFVVSDYYKSKKEKDKKVVGYVGSINQTMDIELLEYVISVFPKVDFVLIGFTNKKSMENIKKLAKKYDNLHFQGEKHFSVIPKVISKFDVLISFKKVDYTTAGGDSMKIYEYLATGKPIVTTPVPPADRFGDLIYVASDKFAFAKYLKRALEENDPEIRQKRIKVAFENSWAKRVDVILEKISDLL